MRGVMEVSSSHHHHHPVRSPSSEGDSGTDDDDSNSVLSHARRQRPMFPIPHSHWFPRPISFRAYAAPRVVRQQGVSNGLRLHIQVTRPVGRPSPSSSSSSSSLLFIYLFIAVCDFLYRLPIDEWHLYSLLWPSAFSSFGEVVTELDTTAKSSAQS
jgi:hypothetical protein